GPLDASGTIRIAEFMGSKLETKAFTEGFHLRHTNHLSSRAAQHDDMSVIDQRVPAASAKETQGIGQEDLAVEALGEPVRGQRVLHGPGRDCPCSWPTPPESAAGRVPLSRIGSVPAHPRTAIAGFCVRWNGRSRGLWRSRPC